jgi:hypothetical protein
VNSDLATIDLQTELPDTDVSASGVWSKSLVKRPEAPWWRLVQLGGVLLFIAASPATAVPDYWFFERRRDTAPTVRWTLEAVVGRRISRVEALQIASQILSQAERERLEFAEWEARGGIQWELEE